MARRIPRYTEDKVAKKKVLMNERVGVSVSRIDPTAIILMFRGSKRAVDFIAQIYRKQGLKVSRRRMSR